RCAGRVEVKHEGRWGTVCSNSWDMTDAAVVCKQLGCGSALGAPKYGRFGPGSGPIWMDKVGCRGTESALSDCKHNGWGKHNCYHFWDAGVTCSGKGSTRSSPLGELQTCSLGLSTLLMGPVSMFEGAAVVRLEDGSGRCAGRVEVKHEGRWGTVCSNSWDMTDAAVVCKQLGCG
ncbi:Deleted in malignant brain tumors 1 protein, partial [Eudyptes chrysolophus]